MSIPAWKVISWAPASATIRHWNRIVKLFRPLGTSVDVDEASGLRHGQVLWGVEGSGKSVGMAWDWREAYPGIVAMSDPMTIVTNVMLLDSDENELPESTKILHLNTGIYQLPWQEHLNSDRFARISASNAPTVVMAA